MQIANHVHLKLIYVNYISVFKKIYMCIYFFSKRRCGGGEWMKRHKSIHQGNNKFISAQQVLLKTYHPPEEYADSSECRGEELSAWESMSSGQTPDEAPVSVHRWVGFWSQLKGLSFPSLRPACSLLSPVSSERSLEVGLERQVCSGNKQQCWGHLPRAFQMWMTSQGDPGRSVSVKDTIPVAFSWRLLRASPSTAENHAAEASGPGFQLLTQVSHLFKRNAPQHQCPIPGDEDTDTTCQASCPVTQAASRGPYLGISTSSYLHFLALPGLPGGSPVSPGLLGEVPSLPRPSWGSPQPLQAFLGGLPNFPGSFLRAHGYGGHRQSDPWVIYSVLQTHSLQLSVSAEIPGPGPSNSISHFAPTFWVLWWWIKRQPRVCRSERDPRGTGLVTILRSQHLCFPNSSLPPLLFNLYFTFQTHCYILPLPGYAYHGQSFPIILHLFALLNQY